MAYNRENFLKKVVEIKEIMRTEQKRGSTQIWVYNHLIRDRYHISLSTFNNYLAMPASRMLRELQEKQENEKYLQQDLFNNTDF